MSRRRFMNHQEDGSLSVDAAPNGIYIYRTNMRLYTKNTWNNLWNAEAVGIALKSNNCRFVISPEEKSSYLTFGGYGTTINNITTTTSQSTAEKDYSGSQNTDKIITQLSGNALAAMYCRNVLFKHGKYGYLGSLGEWKESYNQKSEIDSLMSIIGGEAIRNNKHIWTSTQYDSQRMWVLHWGTGSVASSAKNDGSTWTRAFAQL